MFVLSVLLWSSLAASAYAKVKKVATPPMGWNTYNAYTCDINEEKVKKNAEALVKSGLRDAGYKIVTTDCAWNSQLRDKDGRMTWNATTFPSGGRALGDFLHERGLMFGMYSGGGYKQCNPWDIVGSLNHEDIDAQTFADWGADTLKYDNCFAHDDKTIADDHPDFDKPDRFQKMAESLNKVERPIEYLICQWGRGENVGRWASKIGTTWRITGDIGPNWDSILRITNQATGYAATTVPGGFADLDMLIVGLKNDKGQTVLTPEQERFHFKMWAINKSPLIIGAVLDEMPKHSLELLKKKEIIDINQDPLGVPARLVQRYTEENYDIWVGNLSGNRKVLGVANWNPQPRDVTFDLRSIGIEAADVRDPWTPKNMGRRHGAQTIDLNGHELKLLVLSNISAVAQPPKSLGFVRAESVTTLIGGTKVEGCTAPAGQTCTWGSRIRQLGKGSAAVFANVRASTPGKKFVALDYVNFEDDASDRVRNVYISVNEGHAWRWALPLSGQSWFEHARVVVELDGFRAGMNTITFGTRAWDKHFGPDLVGFEVFESEYQATNQTYGERPPPPPPKETTHGTQEHAGNQEKGHKASAGTTVNWSPWSVACLVFELVHLW